MQRTNGQYILEVLNDHLQVSDNDSLFDDELFTKSGLYHWDIKTCHELSGSVASNLKFVEKVLNSEIDDLCNRAHAHEKLGLSHWSRNMKKSMSWITCRQKPICLGKKCKRAFVYSYLNLNFIFSR